MRRCGEGSWSLGKDQPPARQLIISVTCDHQGLLMT